MIFGHDWREDGVMEAVHGFALQMQPPVPLTTETAQAEAQPFMRNLLPWPDVPRLSPDEQEQLSATLTVESPACQRNYCNSTGRRAPQAPALRCTPIFGPED